MMKALFSGCLKAEEIIDDPLVIAPLLIDERRRWQGFADIVLRPQSTQALQKIMQIAHTQGIAVTPQGGNTGLVGGAAVQGGILLLTNGLTRLDAVNPFDKTLTTGAGNTLAKIQDVAHAAGWLFPLDLASASSCCIGGNIACNAGGMNVLRYGTMRALVAGLEYVMADGTLVSHLAPLHKNTTGYALDQLLIGSEGTLGIITTATLKLFPQPAARANLWLGLNSLDAALTLLRQLQNHTAVTLTTFELISRDALEMAQQYLGKTHPLDANWHIWCELSASDHEPLAALDAWLWQHQYLNAIKPTSENQRTTLKHWRECLSAAQKSHGVSIKHDIALPLVQLAPFMHTAKARLAKTFPQAHAVVFGHLGDGSLHYNVFFQDCNDARVYRYETAVNDLIYDTVLHFGGSIAAEHGIGLLKKNRLAACRSSAEIAAMRAVKALFDPKGILNPGKVLPDSD